MGDIERPEELLSGQRPVSLPWGAVLLALVPGLLSVAGAAGLLPMDSRTLGVWWLGLGAVYLVVAMWARARCREWWPRTVPALLIVAGAVLGHFAYVALLVSPLLLVGGLWYLRRSGRRPSLPAAAPKVLALLLLVATVRVLAVPFLSEEMHALSLGEWAGSVLVMDLGTVLFTVAIVLLPVLLGVPLARRYGMLALLWVLASQQLWLGLWDPAYGVLIWTGNARGEQLLSIWLPLFFLVLAPLWIMRARTERERVGGFLLLPAIGLLSGEWIRGLLFQATPRAYTPDFWLLRGSAIAEFLLLLMLAVILYRSASGREGDAGPLPATLSPPGALPGGERPSLYSAAH